MAARKSRNRRSRIARAVFVVIITGLLLYWAGGRTAGVPEATPEHLDREFAADELKADLDYLTSLLEEVHPDPFHVRARPAFEADLAEVRGGLTSSLSRREFYSRIAPLIASLGDGHTGIQILLPEIRRHISGGGLLFPFEVRVAGDHAYISHNYTSDPGIQVGAALLSVNDVPASDILDRFTSLFGSRRAEHRRAVAEHWFSYLLWLDLGFEDDFSVCIRNPGADESCHAASGRTAAEIRAGDERRFGVRKYPYFDFTTDTGRGVGIMTVDYFVSPDAFETFLADAFGRISDEGIDYLVIDLTNNSGGTTNVGNMLIRYLADEPFRPYSGYEVKVSEPVKVHYKQMIPRPIRSLPVQYLFPQGRLIWTTPPGEMAAFEGELVEPLDGQLRYRGEVFVLINGKTFSAATTFASVVKDYGLGTLVGEETGGLASGYGDSYRARLPNTRLDVTISFKHFIRPSGEESAEGVLPDFHVAVARDDIIAGRNPYLEYTLDLIASER